MEVQPRGREGHTLKQPCPLQCCRSRQLRPLLWLLEVSPPLASPTSFTPPQVLIPEGTPQISELNANFSLCSQGNLVGDVVPCVV